MYIYIYIYTHTYIYLLQRSVFFSQIPVCVCIYTDTQVCIYASVQALTCTSMHVCMHVCKLLIYIYIYTHTYIYTHIHIHICMRVYIYIYIYMYVCMYVCMYVYIYIYICIHIHMHIHKYSIHVIHIKERSVRTHPLLHSFESCALLYAILFPTLFTAQKLILATSETNFQSANVWGPGDFGSQSQ